MSRPIYQRDHEKTRALGAGKAALKQPESELSRAIYTYIYIYVYICVCVYAYTYVYMYGYIYVFFSSPDGVSIWHSFKVYLLSSWHCQASVQRMASAKPASIPCSSDNCAKKEVYCPRPFTVG